MDFRQQETFITATTRDVDRIRRKRCAINIGITIKFRTIIIYYLSHSYSI